MKKLFAFLTCTVVIASLFSACGSTESSSGGGAQTSAEKITVRISTVQMPQQQMGKGIEILKSELESEFGDRVEVKLFPSAQLFSGAEEIEALGRGEADISFVVGGTTETISEKLALVKLPFLFPNVETAYEFLEKSEAAKEILAPIYERGIMVAGSFSSGRPAIANNKRPLVTPDDFKGLKMRAPGKMDSFSVESLGAGAIVTPSEETYSAIQQGVIDGMLTPNSVFIDRKYYEIQKYVTDPGLLSFSCGYIFLNQKFFDGRSADDQALLLKAIDNTVDKMRSDMEQESEELFKKMAEFGCEVYTLNEEERALWKEATSAVYEPMSASIGADLISKAQEDIAAISK